MKNDKLLNAIGQVDDELIQEAETVIRPEGLGEKNKAVSIGWRRWGACAAALLVVAGLGYGALSQLHMGSTSSGSQETASYQEDAEIAAEDTAEAAAEAMESPQSEETAPAQGNSAAEKATVEDAESGDAQEGAYYSAQVNGTDLLLGGFSWSVVGEDGEVTSTISDSAFILDCKDLVPTVEGVGGTVTLTFDAAPDSLTAQAYPADSWGLSWDEAEATDLTVDGLTVTLPDSTSGWIVVATAEWADSGDSTPYGTCSYYFAVE